MLDHRPAAGRRSPSCSAKEPRTCYGARHGPPAACHSPPRSPRRPPRPRPTTRARALPHTRTQVLELGCGWGSWSLFMAAKYPKSRVTAVSNSRTQRAHITAEAE